MLPPILSFVWVRRLVSVSLLCSSGCGIAERADVDEAAPPGAPVETDDGSPPNFEGTLPSGEIHGGSQRLAPVPRVGPAGVEVEAGASATDTGVFCSSLERRAPDDWVVVGLAGSALGLLRADGRLTVTQPLLRGDASLLRISNDRRYVALNSQQSGLGEITLYEIDAGVRWYYELPADGDYASYVSSLAVDDDGSVTVTMGDDTLTFELDGSFTTQPTALANPPETDADGWTTRTIYESTEVGYVPQYVFEDEKGDVRALTHEVLHGSGFPYREGVSYYYFTELDGQVLLVHETSSHADLVETSLARSDAVSVAVRGTVLWIDVAGAPAWRYETLEGVAQPVPFLDPSSEDGFSAYFSTEYVLVTEQGAPRYGLDVSSWELFELSVAGTFDTWSVLSSGRWFLGSGEQGPQWRVDAGARQVDSIDLDEMLKGKTAWPTRQCGATEPQSRVRGLYLLDDGRFGLGLRTETRAVWALATFDGSALTELGASYTNVQSITAYQQGPTWVIRGHYEPADYLYCPYEEIPFYPDADSDTLLSENAIQLVPPNPDRAVVVEEAPLFDESGLCAASGERVYDLEQGTSLELGFRARYWLPPL